MISTEWCITFLVSNLDKVARFHEETLDLEKKYEYSRYVDFKDGGAEIKLILNPIEKHKASLVSLTVESPLNELEKVCKKLKNKRVKFIKGSHEKT